MTRIEEWAIILLLEYFYFFKIPKFEMLSLNSHFTLLYYLDNKHRITKQKKYTTSQEVTYLATSKPCFAAKITMTNLYPKAHTLIQNGLSDISNS